jgi:hypothetical protein
VFLVFLQQLFHLLSYIRGRPASFIVDSRAFGLNQITGINDQVVSVNAVEDAHIKGSGDCPFFVVPTNHKVAVVAIVNKLLDHLRVCVEVEQDWLVPCKDGVKGVVGQSVRMMIWSVQLHQIHHVHKAHMEAGKLVAEDCGCRKRFNGRNVSSASKDYVRFNANIT